MLRLACVIAVAAMALTPIAAYAAETPPKVLRFTEPVPPRTAGEVTKEGLVQVELAISATGDVTDVKIVQSYPKGYFDQAVLDVASTWKFQPRMRDGVAIADPAYDLSWAFYSDLYETGRNGNEPAERGGRVRGITQANLPAFTAVLKGLESGDLKAADAALDVLRKRYDAGEMSVTDVARYFAFLTRYDRLSGHYEVALSEARTTLGLAQFLDNGKVVYGIHLERLASLAALGQNDAAVDYYDSWNKVTKIAIPKEISAYIESLRAKGFGKGHAYFIVDFDETHKRHDRNKQY